MLRGVNKQIIEINETGNRYFEKAVLYVSSECSHLEEGKLYEYANNYLCGLSNEKSFGTPVNKRKRRVNTKRIMLIAFVAAVAAVIIILNIL